MQNKFEVIPMIKLLSTTDQNSLLTSWPWPCVPTSACAIVYARRQMELISCFGESFGSIFAFYLKFCQIIRLQNSLEC
jgi:hypothetical protein